MFGLNEKDYTLISDYIFKHCAEVKDKPTAENVEHFLRIYNENKSKLYHLLGDAAIVSLPFEYEKTETELIDDFTKCNNNLKFIPLFKKKFNEATDRIAKLKRYEKKIRDNRPLDENELNEYCFYHEIFQHLESNYLIKNTIQRNYEYIINGKKIHLSKGQKLIRAMRQISIALDIEDEYEKFRIMHSQVLNQKKIHGTLNISIHPIDYFTASDSQNGWTSCLNWEDGAYKLGTIEMMNSPMVLCAYITSNNSHISINNNKWFNKKWRTWVLWSPEFIIVNKQYPYRNDEAANMVINCLKDLSYKNFNITYDAIDNDFFANNHINFTTNYMYNDIDHSKYNFIGVKNTSFNEETINYSGAAECVCCGKVINFSKKYIDDGATAELICDDCSGSIHCFDCGARLFKKTLFHFYSPTNEHVCQRCFDKKYSFCSCGNHSANREDIIEIVFPFHQQTLYESIQKHNKVCFYNFEKSYPEDICNKLINFHYFRPLKQSDIKTSNSVFACKHCLQKCGIDMVTDICKIQAKPIPFKSIDDRFFEIIDPVLNPNNVSFESVMKLFKFNADGFIYDILEEQWDLFTKLFNESSILADGELYCGTYGILEIIGFEYVPVKNYMKEMKENGDERAINQSFSYSRKNDE